MRDLTPEFRRRGRHFGGASRLLMLVLAKSPGHQRIRRRSGIGHTGTGAAHVHERRREQAAPATGSPRLATGVMR